MKIIDLYAYLVKYESTSSGSQYKLERYTEKIKNNEDYIRVPEKDQIVILREKK